MKKTGNLEQRIEALEKELGHALFPATREGRTAENWLHFLELVKMNKDLDTSMWQRMKNWD